MCVSFLLLLGPSFAFFLLFGQLSLLAAVFVSQADLGGEGGF